MEEACDKLVREKEKAEESFMDLERQILLWEKKIQLAKETAAALDPAVGASDLVAMRAEIHRMKLRLSSLLKLQEKMIQEMEKCVVRRETIGTKAGVPGWMGISVEGDKGRKGMAGTQMLRKAIEDLTRKLRSLVQDVREAEKELQSVSNTTSRLSAILSETTASIDHIANRTIHVQRMIITKSHQKATMATEVLLFQKGGKRYQELKEGKYVVGVKDEGRRLPEWEIWREKVRTMEAVVIKVEDDLSDRKSDLRDTFAGVHQILSTADKAIAAAPPSSAALSLSSSATSRPPEYSQSGAGSAVEVN
ncbi:Coiled-coil domain-containing protein 40 [Gonapodya sp. JEL0774]|nr:Coiled-coil domain-containing protein 40 [Gonapodya sp. JEL0774]